MKLKTITITGADNNVKHEDLVKLSEKYSFVEWGILCSSDHFTDGKNRFPKLTWIHNLQKVRDKINVSGHLCGPMVEKIITGKIPFTAVFPFWKMFNRLQLNLAGRDYEVSHKFLKVAAKPKKQLILQMDGVNNGLFFQLNKEEANVVPLFDLSFGQGKLPKHWPKPVKDTYTGYAGGLNSDNLEEQLVKMNKLINYDAEIWVDMETGVRTDDEFDLVKVEKCLEIASKFV